jgi:transcriptional regulator
MYLPRLFEETNQERLYELCAAYPFGLLLAVDDRGSIEASHLPLLLRRERESLVVLCHVARSNPFADLAARNKRFTAVFSGPHGYVSPTWYAEPDRQVPTWNYAAVHAEGIANTLAAEQLHELVDTLSTHFEGADGWRMTQLAPALRTGMLQGIVGIQISVETLRGKFKLSQNRSALDHTRVREKLEQRGSDDDLRMAAWMATHRNEP